VRFKVFNSALSKVCSDPLLKFLWSNDEFCKTTYIEMSENGSGLKLIMI
jgi:hypothetical protein